MSSVTRDIYWLTTELHRCLYNGIDTLYRLAVSAVILEFSTIDDINERISTGVIHLLFYFFLCYKRQTFLLHPTMTLNGEWSILFIYYNTNGNVYDTDISNSVNNIVPQSYNNCYVFVMRFSPISDTSHLFILSLIIVEDDHTRYCSLSPPLGIVFQVELFAHIHDK